MAGRANSVTVPSQLKPVQLYGGSASVKIPVSFSDVSNMRQVPDDQEVFVDMNGFDSVHFDLCERVTEVTDDEDAFRFHASDLMNGGNPICMTEVLQVNVPNLPDGTKAFAALVHQRPNSEGLFQGMMLMVIRLEPHETDIAITINLPRMDSRQEQLNSDNPTGPRFHNAVGLMEQIAQSFQIHSYGFLHP